MSQKTQAQSLHREGTQRLEEGRSALLSVKEKLKAGEISEEAFRSETEKIRQALDDATKFRDLAAALVETDELSTSLEELGEQPRYRRPMGEGSEDGGPDGPEILTSNSSGLEVFSGQQREVVNRYLRGSELQAPEEKFISKYIDRDGGGLGAIEIYNEVLGEIRGTRIIRNKARVRKTKAASVGVPSIKVKVHLKPTRSGVGKIDQSDPPDIREILGFSHWTPTGKAEFVDVPEELIEDSDFDLVGFLAEEIAQEAFDDEEREFLVSPLRPMGALKAPIPGKPHSGSGAADYTPNDIRLFPFELREKFRANAEWMASKAFYERLLGFRTNAGGADTGEWLFKDGGGPGEPWTVAGYPAQESEFFPDAFPAGNAGDPLALFCDWRHYWIIDRVSLEIKRYDELGADKGMVRYRYRKRYDASPTRLEAFATLDRK